MAVVDLGALVAAGEPPERPFDYVEQLDTDEVRALAVFAALTTDDPWYAAQGTWPGDVTDAWHAILELPADRLRAILDALDPVWQPAAAVEDDEPVAAAVAV